MVCLILPLLILFFFWPGFIADQAGSYKPAFFTAGGICLLAFLLPFLQYCFKPWREYVIRKEIECGECPAKHESPESYLNSALENDEGRHSTLKDGDDKGKKGDKESNGDKENEEDKENVGDKEKEGVQEQNVTSL